MPDSDWLLRLVLLAVAVSLLVGVALELLPFALAVGVLVAPLLGAVLGFRWLAGLLGTPGAVALLAGAVGLALLGYAQHRRR